MRCLLLLFLLFFYQDTYAQKAFLFIKKGGKKVHTFYEGDPIKLKAGNYIYDGYIAGLKNDSIYIKGMVIHRSQVNAIYFKRQKPKGVTAKQLAFITGGVVLSTFGMVASNYETFDNAWKSSTAIGYGPVLVNKARRHISFKRKKYHIGKKFSLQVLDFYLPLKPR